MGTRYYAAVAPVLVARVSDWMAGGLAVLRARLPRLYHDTRAARTYLRIFNQHSATPRYG